MYAKWNPETEQWDEQPPEEARGCGFRIIGGVYMVGPPVVVECDRQVALESCTVCGAGVKQSRGWTWVEPLKLFRRHIDEHYPDSVGLAEGAPKPECRCDKACPICYPPEGRHGLLWVGRRYYTPQTFLQEARRMRVSKRVRSLPKGFEPGKTVVYLAYPRAIHPGHPDLGGHGDAHHKEPKPGLLCAFYPRVERLFPEEARDSEAVQRSIERGEIPVLVPDELKHRTGREPRDAAAK